MGIRAYSRGKVTICTVPVEPPQKLTKGNLIGLAMDRTENQKSSASPVRVGAVADQTRELKPNANEKSQKIIDIITDPHALIAAYQCI